MTLLISIIITIGIIILGLGTGAVSNVTSGGAGVFTIFLLSAFGGLSIQTAVGTVLAASTVFVLVGAIAFYRRKLVDGQLSLTLGLAGVLGAFFAARLASTLQSSLIERGLGAFTLLVAVYSIFRVWQMRQSRMVSLNNGANGESDPEFRSRWAGRDSSAILLQVAVGIVIGLATGLFGVGGGGLTMAVLLFAFKLRAKMMLGTSLMASFFRYAGGSLGYLTTGNINLTVFLILATAGAIGSFVGARFVFKQAKDSYVQVVVVLLLLFVSVEFLIK